MKDPRGEKRKLSPRTTSKCVVCGEQAKFKQFIEVSWFRGDDEVVLVCNDHWKVPKGDYKSWLESIYHTDNPQSAH